MWGAPAPHSASKAPHVSAAAIRAPPHCPPYTSVGAPRSPAMHEPRRATRSPAPPGSAASARLQVVLRELRILEPARQVRVVGGEVEVAMAAQPEQDRWACASRPARRPRTCRRSARSSPAPAPAAARGAAASAATACTPRAPGRGSGPPALPTLLRDRPHREDRRQVVRARPAGLRAQRRQRLARQIGPSRSDDELRRGLAHPAMLLLCCPRNSDRRRGVPICDGPVPP
jgi:hypothetical protein